MRIRHAAFAAAAGSALLAAAVQPPDAVARPRLRGAAREDFAVREGTVGAAALLAEVKGCSQISKGKYRTDDGLRRGRARTAASVPVCKKNGAVFWKADMDIDCDGQPTTKCNSTTDAYFQSATAFQQSDGRQLNSEKLPFIVVPSSSSIWNYRTSGIVGGTVAAVIYKNRVVYAVVGDMGPSGIIGEASYATAEALGINPDPTYGGVESGVTYILFTNSRVSPIESHSGAVALGDELAREFVQNNEDAQRQNQSADGDTYEGRDIPEGGDTPEDGANP
ncbi:glycoside hydrolase family 75 protein [Streptomyces sp. NPDC023998]|uniref:glycoside hydrolase family 75 protein n=1 Tax=Streptomyces sp. NPDC023998 TaxID=3154597 RepID=UPI0033EF4B2B